MNDFLAFYLGGALVTLALQVLDSDGAFWRSLAQATIWPLFIWLTYAYELGWFPRPRS